MAGKDGFFAFLFGGSSGNGTNFGGGGGFPHKFLGNCFKERLFVYWHTPVALLGGETPLFFLPQSQSGDFPQLPPN